MKEIDFSQLGFHYQNIGYSQLGLQYQNIDYSQLGLHYQNIRYSQLGLHYQNIGYSQLGSHSQLVRKKFKKKIKFRRTNSSVWSGLTYIWDYFLREDEYRFYSLLIPKVTWFVA